MSGSIHQREPASGASRSSKGFIPRISAKLRLDKANGWIAGVCAGVAKALGTDPTFVRVGVIVSALFMPIVTGAAYFIAWLVMDE